LITETEEEADQKKKAEKKTHGRLRDYMEPFTAVAVRDAVKFQVRLTGLCPEIIVDEATGANMPLDAESIDGLRILSHKDVSLIQIA
jgi:hypothetical protein